MFFGKRKFRSFRISASLFYGPQLKASELAGTGNTLCIFRAGNRFQTVNSGSVVFEGCVFNERFRSSTVPNFTEPGCIFWGSYLGGLCFDLICTLLCDSFKRKIVVLERRSCINKPIQSLTVKKILCLLYNSVFMPWNLVFNTCMNLFKLDIN